MTAMRAMRCGSIVLVAMLGGCAPRISTLVAHKHYREAICAGHDLAGEGRRRGISEALAADSETYVHVRRVAPGELVARVGPALASEVLARVELVEIAVRSNTLPIDGLRAQVTVQGEDMGAAAAPMSWETLGVATGEQVPGPEQRVSYLTLGNFLRAVGVAATVGVSLPYTNFKGRTFWVAPSAETYARQMPKAAALLSAFVPARCDAAGLRGDGDPAGQLCVVYFVFDRSPTTRWTLTLAQTYEASREVADGKTCRHERSSQVDIGATGAWGTTFGPRMRRLEELPGRPAVLGWTRE